MNLFSKIFFMSLASLSSTTAFALTNHLDVFGYGGYSQINQFSDTPTDNILGTMTGFNAGGMALVTLVNRMVSPVLGLGGQYMQVKSSVNSSTGAYTYSNTATSAAGTAHAGLRIAGPFIRLFLLGNGGYGLSDTASIDVQTAGGGTTLSTINYKFKNHVFYGGSAAFLVSVNPIFKIGAMGTYNMHSATLQNQTNTSASDTTTNYQETSGNLVIDISL